MTCSPRGGPERYTATEQLLDALDGDLDDRLIPRKLAPGELRAEITDTRHDAWMHRDRVIRQVAVILAIRVARGRPERVAAVRHRRPELVVPLGAGVVGGAVVGDGHHAARKRHGAEPGEAV